MRRITNCFICVGLCLLGIAIWRSFPERVRLPTEMETVHLLYMKTNETRPSGLNVELNRRIIRERLACYQKNSSFEWRENQCNTQYLESLVSEGGKQQYSQPEIGNFLAVVRLCPIVYNLCKSTRDTERCIEFERQCIDFSYDQFWRGGTKEKAFSFLKQGY